MNRYEKAAALWVSRRWNLKGEITNVTFASSDGTCVTCDPGGDPAIEFRHNGNYRKIELTWDLTPGRFIEECVALLPEVSDDE